MPALRGLRVEHVGPLHPPTQVQLPSTLLHSPPFSQAHVSPQPIPNTPSGQAVGGGEGQEERAQGVRQRAIATYVIRRLADCTSHLNTLLPDTANSS